MVVSDTYLTIKCLNTSTKSIRIQLQDSNEVPILQCISKGKGISIQEFTSSSFGKFSSQIHHCVFACRIQFKGNTDNSIELEAQSTPHDNEVNLLEFNALYFAICPHTGLFILEFLVYFRPDCIQGKNSKRRYFKQGYRKVTYMCDHLERSRLKPLINALPRRAA